VSEAKPAIDPVKGGKELECISPWSTFWKRFVKPPENLAVIGMYDLHEFVTAIGHRATITIAGTRIAVPH